MSAHSTVFDAQGFRQLIRDSAKDVQTLLQKDLDTVHLGIEFSKYGDLQAMLDLRFTVAIIGQMKVGKSTLMNALIERDLAPVGVTRTTVTINWLRYDSGPLCDKFRIHWKNGSTEDKPLAELQKWLTEENAPEIASVDFFGDAEFLKTTNIVDTPGTRSVSERDQQTTEGFVAPKHDETLFYGGKADAVIYAINPVSREYDVAMLDLFGTHTRLPGASPANSIAVVQGWDTFNNPLVDAPRACERVERDLRGKVSVVLPTSGLFANATKCLDEKMWQDLAKLGTQSTDHKILRYETLFGEDAEGASLTNTERKYLMESVRGALGAEANSWCVIKFSIQIAHAEGIDDGEALRERILEVSGFEALRNALQDRFFSRGTLIQPLTLLRKLSVPVETAEGILQNKLKTINEHLEAKPWQVLYQAPFNTDDRLDAIKRYIEIVDTEATVNARQGEIQKLADKFGTIRQMLTDTGTRFDTDLACLDTLKASEASAGGLQEDKEMLERLFGTDGTAVWQRLGLASESALDKASTFDCAQQQLDHCLERTLDTEFTELYDHAVELLEAILDHLAEKNGMEAIE